MRRGIGPAVALVAFLALTGCATVRDMLDRWGETKPPATDTTTPIEPATPEAPAEPTTPPAADTYVVTEGQRVERTLKVPCSLSYAITGKLPSVEDGGPRDNTHLAWAYPEGGDWGRGNGTGAIGWRDYAVKAYHASGAFAGQARYSAGWEESRSYQIRHVVEAHRVALEIDGALVAEVAVETPETITLGYGWPDGRPGCEGAALTGIAWTEVDP